MINEYYLIENDEQLGPFSLYELEERDLNLETQVLSPLTSEWQSAADLPELTNYFYSRGIYIVSQENMAGFWWRLLAYIIDNVFLAILMIFIGAALGLAGVFTGMSYSDTAQDKAINNLVAIVTATLYNAVFEATPLRGSIGKYICRLAVVDSFGQKETFGKALSRNLGKILSSLVLGIGYLAIFWSTYKQAWHDEMAKTYVIRKPDGVR